MPDRGKKMKTPQKKRRRPDGLTWATVVAGAVLIGSIAALARGTHHHQPPASSAATAVLHRRVLDLALDSTSHGRLSLADFRGHFEVLFFYEGAT